jgi:hypothetical protein
MAMSFIPFHTVSHAAAELSGNCTKIDPELHRLIAKKGENPRSIGTRIARELRRNCAAATFALSACQTPATKTVVQEVRVPVAVQPIKPADVPALPAPLPKRPADARQALDVALAQVCRWVAFGLRAEPLLRVSAGLPPQEAPAYPECSKR